MYFLICIYLVTDFYVYSYLLIRFVKLYTFSLYDRLLQVIRILLGQYKPKYINDILLFICNNLLQYVYLFLNIKHYNNNIP